MTISRLAHVSLEVPDLDEAVAFYSEVFGLVVIDSDEERRYLATGRSNTFELELAAGEAAMDHFAFSVVGEAGLEGSRRYARRPWCANA